MVAINHSHFVLTHVAHLRQADKVTLLMTAKLNNWSGKKSRAQTLN